MVYAILDGSININCNNLESYFIVKIMHCSIQWWMIFFFLNWEFRATRWGKRKRRRSGRIKKLNLKSRKRKQLQQLSSRIRSIENIWRGQGKRKFFCRFWGVGISPEPCHIYRQSPCRFHIYKWGSLAKRLHLKNWHSIVSGWILRLFFLKLITS